ncbi:MAG: hypothetical protein F6K10_26010 [Moorea sp. SIO2B7]|nr:hypothetical protein [Moorena sp. SIO2B7]
MRYQSKTLLIVFRLCLDATASGENTQDRAASVSHQRELVLGIKIMENKKESEINVVRQLLEILNLKGVVFSIDALPCQKKLSSQLSTVKTII